MQHWYIPDWDLPISLVRLVRLCSADHVGVLLCKATGNRLHCRLQRDPPAIRAVPLYRAGAAEIPIASLGYSVYADHSGKRFYGDRFGDRHVTCEYHQYCNLCDA